MDRHKGKAAVITGAAPSMGRATALRMAEEGAAVAILDVLDEPGATLASELCARGFVARHWRCDVAKESDVARVLGEVAAHFERRDILINNAGVSGASKPTHEITEAEWDWVQSINVKGVFFCTKHAIAHQRRAGAGSIINLSSIYCLIGAADIPPYRASKGAVGLMSKNDALIYAPDKIRVNSIHPGFIWTPMVENFFVDEGNVNAGRATIGTLHPLGHLGDGDDIAWGAVYLSSEGAKFVTGAELVIDGGYTAR